MTDSPFPYLDIRPGLPHPVGATYHPDHSVNFAVVSQAAKSVSLCLFTDRERPGLATHEIEITTRFRDVWSVRVYGIPQGTTYGYRVRGEWAPDRGLFFQPCKLLADPYARLFEGPSLYHKHMISWNEGGVPNVVDSAPVAPKGVVPGPDDYDWEGDRRPEIPMRESVFYEMHVKGFSQLNPAVPESLRGTYAGLAHPSSIEYLKGLGVTSLQLLPVHQHMDDGFLLEKGLVNYWGYNTLGFFAPEVRYAAGSDAVSEFRDMVKALHRAGLEVILDVVYNHTCEAGVTGPTCLLRGYDNTIYYYRVDTAPGVYRDYTGTGNSVDVSHPQSLKLVMDSLRYWVEEMHVDGFRFDLAVELGRMGDSYLRRAPFFQAIYQDPVLSKVKLIAEPWDLGPSGYQIGNFPNQWCELNGKFRDSVRSFWMGVPGSSRDFAARITGSEGLFAHNRRSPEASINLVTSHDGFTLRDLVSYNEKHNLANGEHNRDGDSHNISFNHGEEGPTDDPEIRTIRLRQIRNFIATTITSQGVPFLLGGDERFRTQGGNNNAYCQDNETSWYDWSPSEEAKDIEAFTRRMLAFRRDHSVIRRDSFFNGHHLKDNGLPDASWFRKDGRMKNWTDWEENKPGSFALITQGEPSLLYCFNATREDLEFKIPRVSKAPWHLAVDTAEPATWGAIAHGGDAIAVMNRSLQIWVAHGPLYVPVNDDGIEP